jgi:hypothetical protein
VRDYEPGGSWVRFLPGAPKIKDLAAKTKSSLLLWDRCGTFYPVWAEEHFRRGCKARQVVDQRMSNPQVPGSSHGRRANRASENAHRHCSNPAFAMARTSSSQRGKIAANSRRLRPTSLQRRCSRQIDSIRRLRPPDPKLWKRARRGHCPVDRAVVSPPIKFNGNGSVDDCHHSVPCAVHQSERRTAPRRNCARWEAIGMASGRGG